MPDKKRQIPSRQKGGQTGIEIDGDDKAQGLKQLLSGWLQWAMSSTSHQHWDAYQLLLSDGQLVLESVHIQGVGSPLWHKQAPFKQPCLATAGAPPSGGPGACRPRVIFKGALGTLKTIKKSFKRQKALTVFQEGLKNL